MRAAESVPNFSEGRRPEVVSQIRRAAESAGAKVLDVHMDSTHNRSVVTMAESVDLVLEAAFATAAKAVELIDLRHHQGAHPRMGAVDVIPFIPIGDTEMGVCVELAKDLGARLWDELQLPVFFYGEAAADQRRRSLAAIRGKGFEELSKRIQEPQWHPDLGDCQVHPSAGAVAVGARNFLIAFNVNLKAEIGTARAIARTIRTSSGGLPEVQAMAIDLGGGVVQVSMNLLDHRVTSMATVYRLIERLAAQQGAEIDCSELVGMAPTAALAEACRDLLRLDRQPLGQVLEYQLWARG